MTQSPGGHLAHHVCGFPAVQDADGNWRHVSAADGFVCDLLFGGGSMLDTLTAQEEED